MRTGTPGWYKRINRNYNAVSRSCRLTDAVEIDPSRNCVDRMQAAARAAVLTRKVSGLLVFMFFLCMCLSLSASSSVITISILKLYYLVS